MDDKRVDGPQSARCFDAQYFRTVLPFTRSDFFSVFANYNEAVWPAQIAAYLVVGLSVLALAGPSGISEKGILIAVAAMWAWTGIAYHWLFFSAINKAAFVFGAAFVMQAALLLLADAASCSRSISRNMPLTKQDRRIFLPNVPSQIAGDEPSGKISVLTAGIALMPQRLASFAVRELPRDIRRCSMRDYWNPSRPRRK
jgi:Family of unknown function (DUF6064)